MLPTCTDGSTTPPRLRLDINQGNLDGLPDWSTGPKGDVDTVIGAVKAAGFAGIQYGDPAALRRAGLRYTAGSRINRAEEALPAAEVEAAKGADCLTVHVGWGIEDDAEAEALITAVLRASEATRLPIFIETHRATITQDIWRTVQWTKRFPELRFNGDFSHYYTGLELVYGDWAEKMAFMTPIFERTRFIHGRIGNPGCIQVDITAGTEPAGKEDRPYVGHFKEMWTRSFAGFLRAAKPGEFFCFTPELLVPSIYYARVQASPTGPREEGDRWQQALLYCELAKACWAEAQRQVAGAR